MRIIVVTGMARSGTTFLANLLDQAHGVEARHQFFGGRTSLNTHTRRDIIRSLSYYRPGHPVLELTFRQQLEDIAAQFPKLHTFVDVNSYLPYALDALRAALDDVLCFHLVRNGRDVVRSKYGGRKYGPEYKGMQILPDDPSTLDLWSSYSRFEKLCWYWNDTVRRLLDEGVPTVHLERIVSDYQYLREHLLEPSGIDLDENVWRALKSKKLHPSHFRLRLLLRGKPQRPKLNWTPTHEDSFLRICGETMRALGYE